MVYKELLCNICGRSVSWLERESQFFSHLSKYHEDVLKEYAEIYFDAEKEKFYGKKEDGTIKQLAELV